MSESGDKWIIKSIGRSLREKIVESMVKLISKIDLVLRNQICVIIVTFNE